MLLLTRHIGRSVRIGQANVKVIGIDVVRGYVKLGIEAPPEIEIVRDDAKNIERSAKRQHPQ